MENPIQGSSMVPYLPPVVMIEILANCHVETLLKCKVVCKLWYSLISSHQFVRRHLSLCDNKNHQRIILIRYGKLYDLRYHSTNDSMVLEETSIDIPLGGGDRSCFSCITCDGLIWVKEESSGKTLLWNPSTRDSKMLPSISEFGEVHVEGGKDKNCKYGFGYDSNSDDYKVLTLVPNNSIRHVRDFCNFSYKSIVYTVRRNSWRWIQDSPLGTDFEDTTSTFVSGALHWRASVYTQVSDFRIVVNDVVVSFDLTSETYMEVPLPQDFGVSSTLEGVGESRGCLCLLARHSVDSSNDIWVMKAYGVPESWTKAIKIPMLKGIRRLTPITWFVKNGEILLNLRNNMVTYNPDKDSIIRYFATDDDVEFHYPSCVCYEESLVSPNAYSNLVASKSTRLIIKNGDTIRKEVKNIFDKERMNEKKESEEGTKICPK